MVWNPDGRAGGVWGLASALHPPHRSGGGGGWAAEKPRARRIAPPSGKAGEQRGGPEATFSSLVLSAQVSVRITHGGPPGLGRTGSHVRMPVYTMR